ncbi:hypothetical protein BV898_13880 [Hypsibius exemplaris]|uniref:Uncharacterized protein n=1 Tax=Hypsibius exemplaris TaxID=2072580 RepID=A0A1W0W9D1_HYPEX|nr:hypothetical protein BV898_13880 [Hypsibius exemplaris]
MTLSLFLLIVLFAPSICAHRVKRQYPRFDQKPDGGLLYSPDLQAMERTMWSQLQTDNAAKGHGQIQCRNGEKCSQLLRPKPRRHQIQTRPCRSSKTPSTSADVVSTTVPSTSVSAPSMSAGTSKDVYTKTKNLILTVSPSVPGSTTVTPAATTPLPIDTPTSATDRRQLTPMRPSDELQPPLQARSDQKAAATEDDWEVYRRKRLQGASGLPEQQSRGLDITTQGLLDKTADGGPTHFRYF